MENRDRIGDSVVAQDNSSSDRQGKTVEERFLEGHPEVRQSVLALPDFEKWRSSLRMLNIDGERLYVRGGDQLVDDNQLIFEWAYNNGLVKAPPYEEKIWDPSA